MTEKPRKWKAMTAEEGMAILNADPEWVAARRAEEEELQARIAESLRIEAPLRADLAAVGVNVESVWDLVNTSTPYPKALPILLDHLQRDYPPGIADGIARALAVPPARFAWNVIVDLYRKAPENRAKGGLAAALAAMVDDALWPELLELIRDRSNGESRILLLTAVEYWDDDRADPVLAEFEDDPDLHIVVEQLRRDRARRKKQREKRREKRRKQSLH